jgi:hypothetical protein
MLILIKGINVDRWMEHLCKQMILLNEIKKNLNFTFL